MGEEKEEERRKKRMVDSASSLHLTEQKGPCAAARKFGLWSVYSMPPYWKAACRVHCLGHERWTQCKRKDDC